jgi:hypothetical protein
MLDRKVTEFVKVIRKVLDVPIGKAEIAQGVQADNDPGGIGGHGIGKIILATKQNRLAGSSHIAPPIAQIESAPVAAGILGRQGTHKPIHGLFEGEH